MPRPSPAPRKPAPRERAVRESAARKPAARRPAASRPAKKTGEERESPGPMGVRTAPKGHRFHAAEHAIREHALGFPQAHEDFPWGHRAFRVGRKVFLFLAWDDGVFSLTAKLPPSSQVMALSLPFAEPTGYGMGKSGWVTARFSGRDAVPVPLLCRWVDESYRAIAPRKLAALLDRPS